MTIAFFGTSNYCLPILEVLHQNFDLKLVVTRPDKPVGRKKILTTSATKKWAIEHKINSFTPQTLKRDTQDCKSLIEAMNKIEPDLAIVADFGFIIPEAVFNLPKFKTFNIHFSKLPNLRGPSPVQFTLLRGETKAWVTIFELETKMDTGPILWQGSFPIGPTDTTAELYAHLFQETAKILPNLISEIPQTTLIPQDHSNATFCRFLTKNDGFIEWNFLKQAEQAHLLNKLSIQSLPKIQQEAIATKLSKKDISNFKFQISNLFDFYRAVSPWPGMWTFKEGKRMKVLKCHLEDEKMVLDEVQFEGKNPRQF